MKKGKRGISLIVLVITIVIIVILAVAVILSITNNNPIENAKKAAFLNDMAVIKDEFSLYLQKKMIETNGEFDVTDLDGKNIREIVHDIDDKYLGKIEIINGKLQYTDITDMKEYAWAKEAFEGISSDLEVAKKEDSSVMLSNASEGKLENLKIYGSSENIGVGDLLENFFEGKLEQGTFDTSTGNLYSYNLRIRTSKIKLDPNVEYTRKFNSQKYKYRNTAIYNSDGTYSRNDITTPLVLKGDEKYIVDVYSYIDNIEIDATTINDLDLVISSSDYTGKYKIPITVSGKNLAKYDPNCYFNWSGITVKGNSDGTSTNDVEFPLVGTWSYNTEIIPIKKGKYYQISKKVFSGEGGANMLLANASYGGTNEYHFLATRNLTASTPTENGSITMIALYISQGKTFDNYTIGIQIENVENKNSESTAFEPYVGPQTYNIYLNEPLRKLDDAVDYIDFKQGKVIRKVKEENGVLSKLDTPKVESVVLPDILIKSGTNIITIGTTTTPSNIEAVYNK